MRIEYVTKRQETMLGAIYHAEGRLTPNYNPTQFTIDSFEYEYTLTDHLGNSRMMFFDRNDDGIITIGGPESEVLQESHYYPFGMTMDGNWVTQVGEKNRYLYNGKEFEEDFGLDLSEYGARWYDPAIARWNAVDPLAEKYSDLSPYNYVANMVVEVFQDKKISSHEKTNSDNNASMFFFWFFDCSRS